MDEDNRFTEQMPATIGRYKVLESIGYGAMGAVYKGFDPLIKRTLAIKTIRLDIPRQSPQYKSFIERFYHEARISGTLAHPNIVTLFDIGEEGGIPYLAMEFVEGETIAAFLEKGVRFKPERVIALVSQVAAAIDYAHTKGVVHRDIKPSNLILYEKERVKVTDFGIAKLVDSEMTQAGTLLGTPSYMSPEQAMGEKLDGRSDIFSLGVCAFEMLSGEQPFPGANVTSILYKLVHVDPVEPANLEMNGLVPQKWHEVFGKVLAKRPDDRYQTAGAFVQDLEYCLGAWFGSMGETLSEANQPSNDETALLSPIGADPVATPAASEGPSDDVPATVVLKAPTLHPASPPAPPVPPPAPTAATDDQPGATEATMLMKVASTPPPSPPAEEQEQTVMMEATVTPADPGEATMLMGVPAATAPPADPSAKTPAAGVAAAVPPKRTGVPAGLIIGGAGLLLVIAAAALGIVLWKNRAEAPPAPEATPLGAAATPSASQPPPSDAPAAAAKGMVHVESQPAGATVQVNGDAKGVAPLDLSDLPLGTYEVKLDLKGYDPRVQSVTLTEAEPTAEVKLMLSRPQPVMGAADLVSTPAGAAVTVDGAKGGVTPVLGFKLRAGAHKVEMTKEGFLPWSGTVSVAAGPPAKVDAQLKPVVVKATPTPTPTDVVDVNKVYLNSPTEVDTVAKKTSGPSASYPRNAPKLRSGESASVTLSFVVSETGEVSDVKVVESGGKIVDDEVIATVQKWKFTPAIKKGIKVKARHTVKQTFRVD